MGLINNLHSEYPILNLNFFTANVDEENETGLVLIKVFYKKPNPVRLYVKKQNVQNVFDSGKALGMTFSI